MRRSSCWIGPQVLPPFLPSLVQPSTPPPPMHLDPPAGRAWEPPSRPLDYLEPPIARLPSSTGVHESGHCLAAIGYAIPIERAIIGRTAEHPDWLGYVRCLPGGASWGRLVFDLAGIAAERLIFGCERFTGDTSDRVNARQRAGRVAGDKWDADSIMDIMGHAEDAARDLVRRHRDVLIRLAHRLDEAGVLSGQQVADIIGRLPRGPSHQDMRRAWQEQQARIASIMRARLAQQRGPLDRRITRPDAAIGVGMLTSGPTAEPTIVAGRDSESWWEPIADAASAGHLAHLAQSGAVPAIRCHRVGGRVVRYPAMRRVS